MIKLYPYQSLYLEGLPKNIVMAADVGTGKTLMSLAHTENHNPGATVIVIAPAAKIRTKDWEEEFNAWYKGRDSPEYVAVSYERFALHWKNIVADAIKASDGAGFVIIADECHFLCNATSKRSKAVRTAMKSSSFKQFVGLSATPLPNGWRSMENYAVMFGLSETKTKFVNRFVRIDRSRGFPLILGYLEEPLLKEFWNKVSKPLPRSEATELPPSVFLPRAIAPPVEEMEKYRAVLRDRVHEGEIIDSPSQMFSILRQLTTPWRKDEIVSILESTNEHVVIFYNYNSERDLLHKILASKQFKDRKVWEQNGHVSDLPPKSSWSRLKPSVTLVQYQSGSAAIELQYATVTIYMSPTYSYSNYTQSIGRTARNGQGSRTLFYCMKVVGSIDEAVWKALKHKKNFDENLWLEDDLGDRREV